MTIIISAELMRTIHEHGETAYPEEGAGLLLGEVPGGPPGGDKQVSAILPLENSREDAARHNRYLITPQAMLRGEQEAMRRGLDIVGVFHSHPDHPNRPSDFDREWALPWYSYIITTVNAGKALESRSWLLTEDRSSFIEEKIQMIANSNQFYL